MNIDIDRLKELAEAAEDIHDTSWINRALLEKKP